MAYVVYNGSCFTLLSDFLPIEPLMQTDGDLALFFLSAPGILYSEVIDDDWYAAHRPYSHNSTTASFSGQISTYIADHSATVLGCKLQYQICDPTTSPEKGCTPLGGLNDHNYGMTTPRTRREKAVFWTFTIGGLDTIVATLKASSLKSRFGIFSALQGPLPNNQWQLEVEYWHNIVLASLQGIQVNIAAGPGDLRVLQYTWTRPLTDEQRYFCKNQVRDFFLHIAC